NLTRPSRPDPVTQYASRDIFSQLLTEASRAVDSSFPIGWDWLTYRLRSARREGIPLRAPVSRRAANVAQSTTTIRRVGWVGCRVVALASLLAIITARPFAGAWNDGSRLATVEALVDYHTLAIDDSIFVRIPSGTDPSPYPVDNPLLQARGTLDKLYINDHY